MGWAGGHFSEAGLVVAMVGAHEAIPDIEVEAVIAAHFFVVLNVVRGCVDDFSQPRLHEPARMVFVAGVTDDIEGDLPDHEGKKRQWMHGQGEGQQGENASLNGGLQWGEGVGGPGAGIGALMMDAVEELE